MIIECSNCGYGLAISEIDDRTNFVDYCPTCGKKIEWQRFLCDYIVSGKSVSGRTIIGRSLQNRDLRIRDQKVVHRQSGTVILA